MKIYGGRKRHKWNNRASRHQVHDGMQKLSRRCSAPFISRVLWSVRRINMQSFTAISGRRFRCKNRNSLKFMRFRSTVNWKWVFLRFYVASSCHRSLLLLLVSSSAFRLRFRLSASWLSVLNSHSIILFLGGSTCVCGLNGLIGSGETSGGEIKSFKN